MLNLAEYRQRPALLADWLPWAGLVAPGVVLNKDGSFQRAARFRGPDLDSATQGEMIATTARLNNALRRLGSGWALFIEAQRQPAADYPQADFPEALSWLVDEERRAAFEEASQHFESGYYLTLVFLPPEESRARAAKVLYENAPGEGVDWQGRLDAFVAETDRVFDLLDGVMPEIAWLDDSQTLTYLHSTISTRQYRIGVPDVPFYLDALLADVALIGGLAPVLHDQHLRVTSFVGSPCSVTQTSMMADPRMCPASRKRARTPTRGANSRSYSIPRTCCRHSCASCRVYRGGGTVFSLSRLATRLASLSWM